jgi:hypothetical protein
LDRTWAGRGTCHHRGSVLINQFVRASTVREDHYTSCIDLNAEDWDRKSGHVFRTDNATAIVFMLRAGANDAETSTGWGYDRRLWRINLLTASVPGGWVACIGG